ncbi:MAG: hypothetical protein Q9185_003837 [Variospora sp. 1 TL-2023]
MNTTLGESNREFFNNFTTSSSRPPWMNELVAQIQSELLSLLPWLGIPAPLKAEETATRHGQEKQQVRLLDYACGAGEVSKTLLPSVDAALGIDISPGMVKAYNERAAEAGIKGEEMRAVRGDILSSSSSSSSSAVATTNEDGEETNFSGKEWWWFDVAVMSMALHHVASPSDAVKALVDRLRKGGKVVVVDWWLDSIVFHGDRKEGAGHHQHHHGPGHGHDEHHCGGEAGKMAGHAHNVVPGSEHTITRAGFGKEEMETMFKEAGCEGVEFREFRKETRLGDGGDAVMQRLFIIKGTKA